VSLRPFLALLALSSLVGCNRSDEQAAVTPAAYVERIQPKNYEAAEERFPERFSQDYPLVFLRTDLGKPASAVAINADPAGGYSVYFGSTTSDGGWASVTTSLDDATGGQLLRAVEYRLHRNITLSQVHRDVTQREGDLWIYQRLTDGKIACALITFAARLGNEPGAVFLHDVLDLLQRLAAAEPEGRDELLAQLDRAASTVILTESGK
jgi:hypothetical protein